MLTPDIYINDTLADVGTEELMRLSISFKIADIRDVSKRSASASYTIKLPITSQNRNLFGFAEDPDSDSYDQTQKYGAWIEMNGMPVLRGYCKIVGSDINTVGGGFYKVVIIGDNGDWRQSAETTKLSSVDWSEYDATYTPNNVVLSWQNPGFILYPLVDRGEFQGGKNPILYDFKPAFNVANMTNKIFNELGYKVSSSFISSDFYSRLFMDTGTLGGTSLSFRQDRQFRAGLTGDRAFSVSAFGNTSINPVELSDVTSSGYYNSPNANFNTTTYSYVADAGMRAKFYWSFKVTPDQSIYNYDLIGGIVKKKGTTVTVLKSFNLSLLTAPIFYNVETSWKEILTGEEVYCVITIYNNGGSTLTGVIEDSNTAFINQISTEVGNGGTIEAGNWMPDVSRLDFIKSVKHLFNLYFYTDVAARTVYIEPYNEFYLDNDQAVDWSDKLDVGDMRSVDFIDGYSRYEVYKYADDSNDVLVEEINETNRTPYFSSEYVHSNKFTSGSDEIANELFAPTIMRPCQHIDGFTGTNLPTIWQDRDSFPPEQNFSYKPRLYYYAGYTAHPSQWSAMGATFVYYPQAYTYTEGEANDNSLDFADGNAYKGLMSKYYNNTLRTLDSGRLFTANFVLTPLDIINLDPRKPILVGTTYYRLNAIKNYNGRGTCEVELLRPASKKAHKPISEITGEIPSGWSDTAKKPTNYVPVMCEDERVRPHTIVPVMIEDEYGNVVPLYMEG